MDDEYDESVGAGAFDSVTPALPFASGQQHGTRFGVRNEDVALVRSLEAAALLLSADVVATAVGGARRKNYLIPSRCILFSSERMSCL